MIRSVLFITLCSLAAFSCKKDNPATTPDASTALDVRYTVAGTMKDFANSSFTGLYPHEITLIKGGTTQGTMMPKDLGIPGHLTLAGTSTSYYSNFGIIITFDLSTNKITGITNHYGQPSSNGRSATLDPSGVNAWDPATKEIKIKYWLDEPAVFTPHRTSFDETWTYLGPR